MSKLVNWGLSMYGGWYVNLWSDNGSYSWDCYHFEKLAVLHSWALDHGVKLDPTRREDN